NGVRTLKQRVLTCSVENLSGSNDHHIMCNDPEDDFAALAPIGPRPQCGAQAALDHRVDRLRLPPLTVFRLEVVQLLSHPATPPPDRRLLRRPPALRRDDRADALGLADVLMHPPRVIA